MSNVFTSVLSSGGSSPVLDGDAVESNVLSGKTFYSDDANTKQTGTMTNNGAVSQSLNCGGSYTVPEGYHNGSGTVTANSLASQTGVDSGKTAIDASHVHSGYQGWVNGSKVSGTYTEPTITSITPSDSSPVSMSANSNYKPSKKGYAIESYDNSVTQSAMANGAYFPSGMVKMPIAGYAYSSKPQMSETVLWTNSSPTANFTATEVTLSSSIANYDYIKIYYHLMTTQSTTYSVIYPASDVMAWRITSGSTENYKPEGLIGGRSTGNYKRQIFYASNTKLLFNNATGMDSSTNDARMMIPTKISGLKL